MSKRAVDLAATTLCDFSLDEGNHSEDDYNIIDVDVSHNIFDTGYQLPLVLGTQYKGIKSLYLTVLLLISMLILIFCSVNQN